MGESTRSVLVEGRCLSHTRLQRFTVGADSMDTSCWRCWREQVNHNTPELCYFPASCVITSENKFHYGISLIWLNQLHWLDVQGAVVTVLCIWPYLLTWKQFNIISLMLYCFITFTFSHGRSLLQVLSLRGWSQTAITFYFSTIAHIFGWICASTRDNLCFCFPQQHLLYLALETVSICVVWSFKIVSLFTVCLLAKRWIKPYP